MAAQKGWRDLPKTKLALYLYEHVNITDRAWTESIRGYGETRDQFIRRITGKKRPI